MRKLALIFGLIIVCAAPVLGQANAGNPLYGISNDGTLHIPSDWATHNNPGLGSTYIDSLGGLKVCQMTDAVADSVAYNLHYATQNPINSSDQYAFVTDTNSAADWQIRGTGFNGSTCGAIIVPIANMPTRNTHGEMVWDHTYSTAFPWYTDASNPLKFFYTNGDALMSGTITGLPGCAATHNCTVTTAVVHTFSAYSSGKVSIMDSSDIQMTCSTTCVNEHLPLVAQNSLGGHIDNFSYYFQTDTLSAVYTTVCSASIDAQNNSCIHKITTNSVGEIIQFASSGWGTELGQWEWGTPFSSLGPQIDDGHAHTDGGADRSGNPVEIKEGPTPTTGTGAQSTNCPSSSSSGANIQNPTSFSSPMQCMVDMNFIDLDMAYTGGPFDPWVTVSDQSDGSTAEAYTSAGCFVAPTSANWKLYQNEILFTVINANNVLTGVYRMLWSYTRANACAGSSTYVNQPKAAGSQDRNLILFNSSMGYQSGTCGTIAPNCSNVYSAYAPTGTIFAAPNPQAGTPVPTPGAGTYSSSQSVTLSNPSSAPVICYNTTGAPATNGSTGCTTGSVYSGAITVSASETLYFVAGGTGFLDSAVGSAAYVINTGAGNAINGGMVESGGMKIN